MDLSATTMQIYLRSGFTAVSKLIGGLDDDELNNVPFGEGTNSIAGLVVHTCAAVEVWLGHVALGFPTNRDRASEFTTVARRTELQARIDATVATCVDYLEAIAAGAEPPAGETPEAASARGEVRAFLAGDDRTDASLVLHVFEELFVHLGHMESTRDAIVAARAADAPRP